MSMKTQFTVGEVSKICSIPAATLRYYDQIGLIKPSKVGENGYRYYSYEDFSCLYGIKYMKKVGLPLSDMREQFDNRNKDSTRKLFYKQLEQIDEQIKELEGVRSQIIRNISYFEIADSLNEKELKPEICDFPDRYVMLSEIDLEDDKGTPLKDGTQYEMLMCDVVEDLCRDNYWTMGPSVSRKCKEDILTGNIDKTSGAGNMLAAKSDSSKVHIVPGGSYLCMYHRGSIDNISESYAALLEYIENNGYEIAGDIYEIFIVDSLDTKIKEELVTHIQIPIK